MMIQISAAKMFLWSNDRNFLNVPKTVPTVTFETGQNLKAVFFNKPQGIKGSEKVQVVFESQILEKLSMICLVISL